MAKLSLDDVDRHPFASKLDRMSVAQPVGREPPPDAGLERELAQFATC